MMEQLFCEPQEIDGEGKVCVYHGALWDDKKGCLTNDVLMSVAEHREFQYGNYGANRDVPDGTGPDCEWLRPVVDVAQSAYTGRLGAKEIEECFRSEWDYDNAATPEEKEQFVKDATWVRMLREEVAETFGAATQERLEEELIQVAALAVSWVEKIRERRMA